MAKWILACVVVVLLTACGDEPGGDESGPTAPAQADGTSTGLEGPAGWPSAAERQLRPDHEPTPFSAAQIRRGCGPRSRRIYRMETPGKPTEYALWTFRNQTDEGATFETTPCEEDGTTTAQAKATEVTWTQLQGHASYPAANTAIAETDMKTPAGTLRCMHYRVTREGARGKGLDEIWFAWDLPGSPVRMERYVNGKIAFTLTLMEHEGIVGAK